MQIKKILQLSLIFTLSFILIGCTSSKKDETNNNQTASKILQIEFKNLSGETKQLSEFDKPLVINSWAGWCSFCKEELKVFAEVQQNMNDKITIIAINRGESKQKAVGYLENLEVKNDLTYLLDKKDRFYRKIGGIAMPETIFINKQGKKVFHQRGPLDEKQLKQIINKKFEA